MTSNTTANILASLILCLLVVAFIAALWWYASFQCAAKWDGSGMATSWGPVKGCQIQHLGKWIPSDSYREMP